MTAKHLRVLISVSDKTGLDDFARRLAGLGATVVSTGGTASRLRGIGIDVTDISTLTGFPEIMDGRVKTLHPRVHGGLLGRGERDAAVMAEHGIEPFDLLVVNLYPFEATVARDGCTRSEAIENIDIGGPAMIRAAAKNHEHIGVVVDPVDYQPVVEALERNGELGPALRRALARKAFGHTAAYDAAVWSWLRADDGDEALAEQLPLGLNRRQVLRYGENPHQRGALYTLPGRLDGTIVGATTLQGKSLSYNNVADADAALACVQALPQPACVIVKHANPCGVGLGQDARDAYVRAWATDPTSAFGGIIAFNVPLDRQGVAAILDQQFVEVIVAPRVDKEAAELLAAKPNIRVLETGNPAHHAAPQLRFQHVAGGMLVQDEDIPPNQPAWQQATRRAGTAAERRDAELAWTVARFVKSNAIVLVRDGATIGIGAGQPSRVMSVRIAAWKAHEAGLDVQGAVLASDAFFPFRDGIDLAAEFGVASIVQPGGSVRDKEVIAAADEHGMAMWLTGVRHFRH